MKARKIAVDFRAFVSYERIGLEWRVWGDQNDRLRAANYQSLCEFRHGFDGSAHTGDRLAAHLWHHDGRMWCNAGKDQATVLVAHSAALPRLEGTAYSSSDWRVPQLFMAQFDVLIVGAGPAGSFAAELLAKGGAKVALFDGRPAGEPKACGGGVTAKALNAWPELLNAVGRTIHELDLYSPSGKRLHLKLDEPFAVYSRVVFDGYLRDRARDAGAQVFSEKISSRKITKTDNGWRITSETGEWSGAVLVGADGANSGIAKMLAGPLAPSDMEVAFGYRAPLPINLSVNGVPPTVVAFLPRWVGYAWAFPR